ncbi:MAG: cytochrome B [Sphingobacteriaceae bacterium]|nr:MAG: cytochrome B [Sphingobacteriaceae bacterium]
MDAYSIINHLHSGFRYIVLVLLILAIVQSLLGAVNKSPYSELNRKINMFAMISVHTQLLIGIVLYIISPMVQFTSETMKNPTLRYFAVEHWFGMIIAIALITIGHAKSKKIVLPEIKHRTIAIYYAIALTVVVGTLIMGHIPVFK